MAIYDFLDDKRIRLIATFDEDGIPLAVVRRDPDGKDLVCPVDQEAIDTPIPRGEFRDGPLRGIDLLTVEPFEVLVYRPVGAGANGVSQTALHIRSKRYPPS